MTGILYRHSGVPAGPGGLMPGARIPITYHGPPIRSGTPIHRRGIIGFAYRGQYVVVEGQLATALMPTISDGDEIIVQVGGAQMFSPCPPNVAVGDTIRISEAGEVTVVKEPDTAHPDNLGVVVETSAAVGLDPTCWVHTDFARRSAA